MKPNLVVPHDPHLLAPCRGEVVDGHHVLLRWERMDGAERYRVQIATESDFRDVVFEQDVPGGVEALIVRRHFPEDDRLLFWRVRTGTAEGWSEGEHIESFTSGTAEQVGHSPVPDVAEPFGPVAALFSAASLEAIAEVVPGRQPRIEAALGEEHPEGVEAAEVFNIEVGLMVAAAFVVGALLFILIASC